jgi:hypothetical protein
MAIIRENLERQEVKEMLWRDTHEQLADALTKGGASADKLLAVLQCERGLDL